MNFKHLFGPVVSRRLGLSLGVDLVTPKVCNLNCVYCECGATTILTMERKEWVSSADIIAELSEFLSRSPALDVVTITGSGEPTLNTGLKTVIGFLKRSFPHYKTALLTNGTLLHLPEVREAAAAFDYVLPSLDAVSDAAFKKINRPHTNLDNKQIIRGIARFSCEYKGNLWIEVFIVPDINDSHEELGRLKEALLTIGPGRVQLNTLDRPGASDFIAPAPEARLREIAELFSPLPVEIISRRHNVSTSGASVIELESAVAATLHRRPSTVEDLSLATGRLINDVAEVLSRLVNSNKVKTETINNKIFYRMFK